MPMREGQSGERIISIIIAIIAAIIIIIRLFALMMRNNCGQLANKTFDLYLFVFFFFIEIMRRLLSMCVYVSSPSALL